MFGGVSLAQVKDGSRPYGGPGKLHGRRMERAFAGMTSSMSGYSRRPSSMDRGVRQTDILAEAVFFQKTWP
jgi:hypothetical protein